MKLTPRKIVENNFSYSVPIYQRLFEWDDKNVGTLLDDLWHAYLKGANDYYIGMLTRTSENELVDGQQRLVVMTLLGCVLKEYYSDWERFIFANNTSDELRLKFPSRPDDEVHLKHLVSLKHPDKTDKTKMGKAVWGIYNFLKEETEATKIEFAEYVFNHLSFFISKLPNDYDPVDLNRYFERMNTQGKNLEPHEILKVKLLRHFVDDSSLYMRLWDRLSDANRLFIEKREYENEKDFCNRKKQILQCGLNGDLIKPEILKKEIGEVKYKDADKTIKDIKPSSNKPENAPIYGSGSRSPLSFPQLLLQTLYYWRKRKIELPFEEFFDTKKIIKTFDMHLPSEGSLVNKNDILDFLKNLVKCCLALEFCFIRPMDGDYSLDMDLSTKGSENEEKRKLYMFESMLFVSESPLTNRKTNYNWFLWLLEFVDSTSDIEDFHAGALLRYLRKKDDEHHSLEFNTDNIQEKLSYDNVDRYWFWRLDYYLWERREEFFRDPNALRVAENYIFRYNRSIEHVAPQHPKLESSLQWEETADDTKIRNSFGNLVMISSGLNSSLSSASYEVKRAHVESYSSKGYWGSIESLKLLLIFTKYETWNRDKIKAHQEEMIEILKKSFGDV